jgi:kinesin family protein 6/9
VDRYIKGELGDIEVQSLRQIRELFRQFKNIILEQNTQIAAGVTAPGTVGAAGTMGLDTSTQAVAGGVGVGAGGAGAGFVGDVKDEGGFHLGMASDEAAPREGMSQVMSPSNLTQERKKGGIADGSAPSSPVKRVVNPPSEMQSFEDYKEKEGAELQMVYLQNKGELGGKKQALKKISSELNGTKKEIDVLAEQINMKREQKPVDQGLEDGVEVIDEEEFALIRTLKQKKKQYQEQFAVRKDIASEVAFLKGATEQAKMTLCNTFLEWYKDKYPDDESGSIHGDGDDVLDDGEQFDLLEKQRIMEEDPESMSYHNAIRVNQINHKKKLLSKTSGVPAGRRKGKGQHWG